MNNKQAYMKVRTSDFYTKTSRKHRKREDDSSQSINYSIRGDKWDEIGLQELLKGDSRTLLKEKSEYQDIHLVEATDIRLYLDQQLQFSSLDERIYHEALIHPAFSLTSDHDRVLVLGGGDGLALREILKYKDVRHVDLVDLDPLVLKAAGNIPSLVNLNKGSLHDKRVTVHCQDAMKFLSSRTTPYNIIIIDFPDPIDKTLSKLYSHEFYVKLRKFLTDDGILVCQSGSPDDTPIVFWSIDNTIESAGFNTLSYHTIVPSFGDWGFHIASKKRLSWDHYKIRVTPETLPSSLKDLSYFHRDVLVNRKYAIVNTLNNLQLHEIFFKEVI